MIVGNFSLCLTFLPGRAGVFCAWKGLRLWIGRIGRCGEFAEKLGNGVRSLGHPVIKPIRYLVPLGCTCPAAERYKPAKE